MLERDVEKTFVAECRKRGWLTMKAGQCGWPDRIVVTHDGRHYWVELKAEGGRPSALQFRYINMLTLHGADARFVYGVRGVYEFFNEVDNAS